MGITGLNHLTFAVRDLAEAFDFYTRILGFQPLVKWPHGAYLLAGDVWIALTLDPETRRGPLAEYTHAAFSVSPNDFPLMTERILASGAASWQENSSEGASLYFLDPDGHKLELHASDLAARLEAAKASPWPGAEFFA